MTPLRSGSLLASSLLVLLTCANAAIEEIRIQDNSDGDYLTLLRGDGEALTAVNFGPQGGEVLVGNTAFTNAGDTNPAGSNWTARGTSATASLATPPIDDLFFSELSSPESVTLTHTNLDPARVYLVQVLHGEPRDCCATTYAANTLVTDVDAPRSIPPITIGNGVSGENPPAAGDLAIVTVRLTGVTQFTYTARPGPGRAAAISGFQVREGTAPVVPTGSHPFISEFVAVGNDTLEDEDGDTPDWIEIYNPTSAILDLAGYHLTDDLADRTKWTFPTTPLQPGEYLVVFASGKDRDTAGRELHANFRLDSEGEALALVAPGGSDLVSAFDPAYPRQEPRFSYGTGGLSPDGDRGYFGTPTPGRGNAVLLTAPLLAPLMAPPCGTFSTSTEVAITSPFPAGQIRFTTDGSEPNSRSRVYTGPITITATTHLRARIFDLATGDSGAIASAHFERLATAGSGNLPAPSAFTSNLPIMVVETFSANVPGPGAALLPARLLVHEVDPLTGRSSLANPPDACLRIGIRRRGQSSSGFPKPQYRVELRDDNDVDTDYPLLGLPEESDWVFNGPYTDKALIRNPLAFALGREIGIQAPRSAHFEMFLSTNGGTLAAGEYVGVYLLLEKIKDGRNRTDLANLEPTDETSPDITGGYMMRFEPPGIADDGPRAAGWSSIEIIEPNAPTLTQQRWLGRYLDEFVGTLGWRRGQGANNNGVPDPDPLTGYPAFIDVDSFVSLFIVNELLREQDSYVRSDYMYKDREGLLHKGPLWDYNLTAGTGCCFDNRNTSGWQYQQNYNRGGRDHSYEPDWFVPLMRCPDFRQRVTDRWAELRGGGVLNEAALFALMDHLADPLAEAADRNFTKWNILSSSNVGFPSPATNTWPEQIAFMKNWLRTRARWIDRQFPALPAIATPSGSWPAGTTVEVVINASRAIHYTTDGSDPRLPGGGLSPSARPLTGGEPIPITSSTRLVARTFSGSTWSAPVTATYIIGTPANASNLLVTELNYHPRDPDPDEAQADPSFRDDDFEFIEVRNISSETIDLGGARLVEGVDFTVPTPAVLAPGAHALLVENLAAFETRYGTGLPVLGVYANKLDNDGDTLRMVDVNGAEIFQFTFNDTWYRPTDGKGFTMVTRDEERLANYEDPSSWAISCQLLGNPGRTNGTLHTREFFSWRRVHFSPLEMDDPFVSGPNADPDLDGLTNLLEFALGLDPRATDSTGLPAPVLIEHTNQAYLALSFRRQAKVTGLSYAVEASSDLATWTTVDVPVGAPLDHGDGTETILIRDNVPLEAAGPHRFLRLVVELQ